MENKTAMMTKYSFILVTTKSDAINITRESKLELPLFSGFTVALFD